MKNFLKIWMIWICLFFVKSDFVGKVKISGFIKKLDPGLVICLGTASKNVEMIKVLRCNGVSDSQEFVDVWFQDKEIFSHLIILDRKSWEKMNLSRGNLITMNELGANVLKDYAVITLLLPNQERNSPISTVEGMEVFLSLECTSNHYGPGCMTFCDETKSEGRYVCHYQTGEMICQSGWTGEDCSKNAVMTRKSTLEVSKNRPKRSNCLDPPCEHEEAQSNDIVEMDFRGAESLSYCGVTCNQSGTQFCVIDEEEEGPVCKCKEGYSGQTCSVMDICYFELCVNGGKCQKFESGESECTCPEGFIGSFCQFRIDHCSDDPCGEFGGCESDVSGFRCYCDVGFTGETCKINIDDCDGDPCSGNGECYDGINSHDCECFEGYYGESCEHKLNGCAENPCQNGGNCSSEDIYFECDCPEGYEGLTCAEKTEDPCEVDPCNGRGTCYAELEEDPEHDSYKKIAFCTCHPGYIGDSCEIVVSFCDVAGACPSNSTCLSMSGEYMCICPFGYQGEFCEEECEDCQHINELHCHEDPCKNGGRCIAIGEDIRCVCRNGYYGSRCDKEIDYCLEHQCGEHGICQSTSDGFKCLCNEGFTGDHCEDDVDECKHSLGLCKNEGECTNLVPGYRCDCLKGFTGKLCEIAVDACNQNPCHNGGACVADDEYSYVCHCRHGYLGVLCEHKVPCENNPCQNGGECEPIDSEEGIHCLCKEGFQGRRCEHRIHPCTARRMLVNGTFQYIPRDDCGTYGICQAAGETDFTCKCLPGYQGELCDQKSKVTECQEPYCVCGSAIRNRKFLSQRDETDAACSHSRYGTGTCSTNECISKTCNNPPQLLCQYSSQCLEQDVSSRIFHGRYEVCAKVWMSFTRVELPEETTVQGICERLRKTDVLANVLNVSPKCFLHSKTESSSVITVSFEGRLKLNARRVRKEFLKYFRDLILSSNFTEIEDRTTSKIFEAIDNVTDGSSITVARKLHRPTSEPEVPRETYKSQTTLIVVVACVVIFLIIVLIIGAIIWMKKRKPVMTSSPVISRTENNNVHIDTVKFSKRADGKVNPLLYAGQPQVYYVETEEAKSIPSESEAESNGAEATNSTHNLTVTTNPKPGDLADNQR